MSQPSSPSSPFHGFESTRTSSPIRPDRPRNRRLVERWVLANGDRTVRRTNSGRPRSSSLEGAARLQAVPEEEARLELLDEVPGVSQRRDTGESSRASLEWEQDPGEFSFIENIRRSRFSASTQFSVPIHDIEQDVFDIGPGGGNLMGTEPMDPNLALQGTARYMLIWEEELSDLNPEEMETEHLRNKLAEMEKVKSLAQEVSAVLLLQPDEVYSAANRERSAVARKGILAFTRQCSKVLHEREVALRPTERANSAGQPSLKDKAREAAIAIRASRVEKHTDSTLEAARLVRSELEAACRKAPQTDSEFRQTMDVLSHALKRMNSVQGDLKNLLEDALEAGKVLEAETLDTQLRELVEVERDTEANKTDWKVNLGVFTSTGGKNIDVKPPQFSGTEEDKLDFYMFSAEWEDYASSKNATRSELLRILTRTCLQGVARAACLHMESIGEVFKYLKDTYGNVNILFMNKIEEIRKLGPCQGSVTKKRDWAVNVRSQLTQLKVMAKKHGILEELYYSSITNELQRALPYKLLEKFKENLQKEGTVSKPRIFNMFFEYLDTVVETFTFEVHYNLASAEAEAKHRKSKETSKISTGGKKTYTSMENEDNELINPTFSHATTYRPPEEVSCKVCNGKHTYMFYCPKFVQARVRERVSVAGKQKCCFRCLRLDSNIDLKNRAEWQKSHEVNCQTTWTCKEGACKERDFPIQYHITMCTRHIEENKNKEEEFVKELDNKLIPVGTRFFTMFPSIYLSNLKPSITPVDEPWQYPTIPDVDEPSIFLLQHVSVEDHELLMFYDSGCMSASISSNASRILDTTVVRPGPTTMHVAGAQSIELKTGEEQFKLFLADGYYQATITALHMPEITHPFPIWELEEAWTEINTDYHRNYPGTQPLPPCPQRIGGKSVDIMLGIRYSMYWPVLIHQLPGGLGVYRSQFAATRGEMSILGGPHRAWRKAIEVAAVVGPRAYLTSEARAYCAQGQALKHLYVMPHADVVDLEVGECYEQEEDQPEPSCMRVHCEKHSQSEWTIPARWSLNEASYSLNDDIKRFLGAELSGTEVQYRCLRCRNCTNCQQEENVEFVSFKEEAEQHLIESSVTYDPKTEKLTAKLPFVKNPDDFLFNNFNRALRILDGQIKKVSNNEQSRMDVMKAHDKLYSKGFTTELAHLEKGEIAKIEENKEGGYFIPWRVVYNSSSLSTPVRMVFDASSVTPNGDCLNNCLAKGENRLCKIQHVLLRFRLFSFAVSCDIKMAYNGIDLDPAHYQYQRYLWRKNLNPENPVEVMVIKSLIYGVRSSGQQLLAGLNKLADYCEENVPGGKEGAKVLKNDTYVDDCLSSSETQEMNEAKAESIVKVLARAGMSVKAVTKSRETPSAEVSADGKHVGVVGMLWDSAADTVKLDIKELFFGKALRGKIPSTVVGDVKTALSKVFTRRTLVGKVAGVFDPLGLLTPVVAMLKLDLQEICKMKLGWDDRIPEDLLDKWVRNLDNVEQCREVVFRRAVIPIDAVSLSLDIIVSADSSQNVAVACVHTKVLRTTGEYSVQLLCAKSKLVTLLTVPKGELRAATMAASLGHTVRHNYGSFIASSIYVTDSTIALFWMSQDERPLQTGVRNCVIEIRRLTALTSWNHIESSKNVADIATRPISVKDLKDDSEWISGKPWMRLPMNEMPVKTIQEIQLSGEEKRLAAVELKAADVQGVFLSELKDKVSERYTFSKYLLDPCRYRWDKVTKIMGLVIKFVEVLCPKFCPVWRPPIPPPGVQPEVEVKTDEWFIQYGENYFFFIGTQEVKEFMQKKDYVSCTAEKDGVLRYTSRILDGQDIDDPENTMYDLHPLSFVKPVLDRFSPISYSLMLYCHSMLARHRSATSTLLESRGIAFIFRGRDLANEVREKCVGCRRFKGNLLEAEMAPIHSNRLTIAPAFYFVQVDIFGPFSMMCEHNHRSQIKAYGVIFKDPSTGAVNLHTMQNYTTEAFLQAYTRHSARYGHPCKIFIDPGTQLVKACKSMEISETNLVRTLETKHRVGVEFSVCAAGAHNAQGMAERGIQEVKKLLRKVFFGIKVDLLSFETNLAWIANELNNLPICLGSRTENLDHLDLITPNRLILGRNNRRAMTGYARISTPSRLMDQMDKIYRSWWKIWKEEKLEQFIPKSQRWTKTSMQPIVGDIVMFIKVENEVGFGESTWGVGRVQDIEVSEDGVARTITIQYKNATEGVFRSTRRSVRKVAILCSENVLELVDELNAAAREVDIEFSRRSLSETKEGLQVNGLFFKHFYGLKHLCESSRSVDQFFPGRSVISQYIRRTQEFDLHYSTTRTSNLQAKIQLQWHQDLG